MIYIPRFQKRTRLDTRGGGSPNVPAVSGEAVRLEAMSKVLDQVATKILPVALSLNEEEELEQNKTFINDIRTNVSDRFKEAPVNPSQEWYDSNIQPIYDEAKKNDRYTEGVAKRIDNIFKEKNYVYNNKIINYKLKTVGVQKQKNLMDSLKQDIMEADAGNKLSIDAIYDEKFNSLTENLLWEEKTRTGKELAQRDKIEFFNRADINQRYEAFDISFKSLIKNKISQEITNLPDEIPLNEKVETIEGILYPKTQVQNEKANNLKEQTGVFNFLDTAKFYELDDEAYKDSLVKKLLKVDAQKTRLENRLKEELTVEEKDKIYQLKTMAQAAAIANDKTKYEDIKTELYDNFQKTYIPPFESATQKSISVARSKRREDDREKIFKKFKEDSDFFAGTYYEKLQKIEKLNVSNPHDHIKFVITMDKKEAAKVRDNISTSTKLFNTFAESVSEKAPSTFGSFKPNIKLKLGKTNFMENPYEKKLDDIINKYSNRIKVLEIEMTSALKQEDTSRFNKENLNSFDKEAVKIFKEEIYFPYKKFIEDSISDKFLMLEDVNMLGGFGDRSFSKAFNAFSNDFDDPNLSEKERQIIVSNLAKAISNKLKQVPNLLDDDQLSSLEMVSRALPILQNIKNSPELLKLSKEVVSPKEKTSVGQITN